MAFSDMVGSMLAAVLEFKVIRMVVGFVLVDVVHDFVRQHQPPELVLTPYDMKRVTPATVLTRVSGTGSAVSVLAAFNDIVDFEEHGRSLRRFSSLTSSTALILTRRMSTFKDWPG